MPLTNLAGVTNFTGLNVGAGGANPAGTDYVAIQSSTITVVATTVANGASATTTAALTGFAVGDPVFANPGSASSAGLSVNAWISAADTVTIQLQNVSASTLTQTALPVVVTAFKR